MLAKIGIATLLATVAMAGYGVVLAATVSVTLAVFFAAGWYAATHVNDVGR
jgi:ABC-type phosphate/phosphonate transport system permease subunit